MRVGQRVKVFADYGNNTQHTYQGLVTWISPKAEFTPKSILTNDERADQVYAVKVSVKKQWLHQDWHVWRNEVMNAIEVNNICKSYGEIQALRDFVV